MNPFDLRGPEFLLFYLVFAAFVLAAVVWLRRSAETSAAIGATLADPYAISYLRDGPRETLHVAILALIDAGLLRYVDTFLQADAGAESKARRPLERAILKRTAQLMSHREIESDARVDEALRQYETTLVRMGAMPDSAARMRRGVLFAVALLLLWGAAATKILVALSRGRHNIWFLMGLAALSAIAAGLAAFPHRTVAGDVLLRDLRTLFEPLRARFSSFRDGVQANERALVVALFGFSLVRESQFPGAGPLLESRRFVQPSSGSGTSGCGGSGGCGGGGGGCGGGGCGGGCGGCGS